MKKIICWFRGHKWSEPQGSGKEFGFYYTSTCYRCGLKSQMIRKKQIYFRAHKEWLRKWRKACNDR